MLALCFLKAAQALFQYGAAEINIITVVVINAIQLYPGIIQWKGIASIWIIIGIDKINAIQKRLIFESFIT